MNPTIRIPFIIKMSINVTPWSLWSGTYSSCCPNRIFSNWVSGASGRVIKRTMDYWNTFSNSSTSFSLCRTWSWRSRSSRASGWAFGTIGYSWWKESPSVCSTFGYPSDWNYWRSSCRKKTRLYFTSKANLRRSVGFWALFNTWFSKQSTPDS